MLDDLLIGYDEDGLPIWAMFGAEGDDTGGDDTDEGGEDDEAEDEDEDDSAEDKDKGEPRKQPRSAKAAKASPYRPPSQKEWERTQAALRKANDEQRAARKTALEKAKAEGMTEATAKAREEASTQAEGTWKPRVVKSEAKAELVEMGCKNPSRLIKLIDQDKVTIQEDGSLLGLEAQLHELKAEWPELFKGDDDETPKPKTKKEVPPAKKVGAAAGSSKKDEGEGKKVTGAQLVANRLLGVAS